jgi:hypothetical protein
VWILIRIYGATDTKMDRYENGKKMERGRRKGKMTYRRRM